MGREIKEKFRFEEDEGEIRFSYIAKVGDDILYSLDEDIPANIVEKGKKAMLNYASKKIQKVRKELKGNESIEEDIRKKRKNYRPLKTEYKDGIVLKGRIVEATDSFIRVKLDTPLKGESSIYVSYVSAMPMHYFSTRNRISKDGYDAAREALCTAYERALHKPQRDLVHRLNSELKRGKVRY